ncbi:MAG: hypothetical protein JW860_16060, partial [Sedimentisphaerales bacterium]|nr:hypothetical protein [Sedimentisphaerales bacterium]
DRDQDGTPDCIDYCPDDPCKVEDGVCGCGVSDIDSDEDGTPDCFDECPDDPCKEEVGFCGCGVPDEDLDEDQIIDCMDPCPGDPNNTCIEVVNDDCEDAVVLMQDTVYDLSFIAGASSYDMWYSFTPESNGDYFILPTTALDGVTMTVFDSCGPEAMEFGSIPVMDMIINLGQYNLQDIDIEELMMNGMLITVLECETIYIRFTSGLESAGDFGLVIHPLITPAQNDDCSDAYVIEESVIYGGITDGATGLDEVTLHGTGDICDVWFSFTANDSAIYEIQWVSYFGAPSTLGVYEACDGEPVGFIGEEAPESDVDNRCGPALRFNGQSQTTYLIRLAGKKYYTGPYGLEINYVGTEPGNDRCVNATGIDLGALVTGDLNEATGGDLTEIVQGNNEHRRDYMINDGKDRWYTFTAESPGLYAFYVDDPCDPDDIWTLSVFDTCGADNLLAYFMISNEVSGSLGFMNFYLPAAGDYLVRVATVPCRNQNYSFTLLQPDITAPDNDLCENAESLNPAMSVSQESTVSATGVDITMLRGEYDAYDVWYSVDLDPGRYTVNLSDTAAAIYTEATVSVYDSCGGEELAFGEASSGDNFQTKFNVATAGTYLIRVANKKYMTTSNFDLSVVQDSPEYMANDFCIGAIEVFEGVNNTGLTTEGASGRVDRTWPQPSDVIDVWYKFTPTLDGVYAINLYDVNPFGGVYITTAVYDSCAEDIAPIMVARPWDEGYTDPYVFIGMAGTEYYIRFAANHAQTEEFEFEINYCNEISVDPLSNDFASNPAPLTPDVLYNGTIYDKTGYGMIRWNNGWDNADVWFSFTAARDGIHEIEVELAAFNDDVSIAAFIPTESMEKPVMVVGSEYPTDTLLAQLNAQAGTEYLIRLAVIKDYPDCGEVVVSADNGEYDYSILLTEPPICEYNLTINVVGGGSVNPASGMYPAGEVIDLEAIPDSNWYLVSWDGTDDDTSTDLTNTVTMDGDKIVNVVFGATQQQYTLTIIIDGDGSVNLPLVTTHEEGAEVNLIATADVCNEFSFWSGDGIEETSPNLMIVMDGDKTVTAHFTALEVLYTLNITPVGQGTFTPASGSTYPCGTVVDLSATGTAPYVFTSWSGDISSSSSNTTITMDSDKYVTVTFTDTTPPPPPPPTYTLTVNVIGNGTVTPGSGTYNSGTTVTLTATPGANTILKSWSGTNNDSSTSNVNTVTMNANKMVTVEFESEPDEYELTVTVLGGTATVNPTSGMYDNGEVLEINAIPDQFYNIVSWNGTDDDDLPTNTKTVTMDSDRQVTIQLGLRRFTLTATVVEGNGDVTPTQAVVNAGSTVTLVATPDADYRLKEWTGTDDDTLTDTTNTVFMDEDKDITVAFESLLYDLDYSIAAGEGVIPATSGTYTADEVVPLIATPAQYYRVKAWHGTDDDSSTSATNAVTMSQDKQVTVEFEPIPVELDYQLIGGHAVSPVASGTYDMGEVVDLLVTPDPGYRVKAWYGTDDDIHRNNTNTVTMLESKQVVVEIAAIMTAQQAKATAGKKIGEDKDMVKFKGFFDASLEEMNDAEEIQLKIWSGDYYLVYEKSIPFSISRVSKKGTFKYKDQSGEIVSVKFSLKKGSIDILVKNTALQGLTSPIFMDIIIGDYIGLAELKEDIINGPTKPIPMRFLREHSDALRCDKAPVVKSGNKGDSVSVRGSIAAEDPTVNLTNQAVIFTWGAQTFTVPAGSFSSQGNQKFSCKKIAAQEGGMVSATIDFNKSTFSVSIGQTTIDAQTGSINFGIAFADFDETIVVEM